MSDRELGDVLNDASLGGIVENWRENVGKKARALFTSDEPAKGERRPQVGDVVWVYTCCDGADPNRKCSCPPKQRVVSGVDGGEFWWDDRERRRKASDLGKTWWWSDHGAKGAESSDQPQGGNEGKERT